VEPIKDYDGWKLASPVDESAEQEIDAIERGLDVCPFCFGPSYFEESYHGWYVTCSACGVSMPGNDPVEASAKWATRPTVGKLREGERSVWTGW
jgi:uncharacterized protein (DUF983 family)